MKTSTVTPMDLGASVWAVPPLARRADLSLHWDENRRLIHHLETHGVQTLLYGGNANFYHLPLSEYAETLDMLAGAAGPDTWVIPSAGPDYGRLADQAAVLRGAGFPAVMALPYAGPATAAGRQTGLRRFAERAGRPIILYLNAEHLLTPESVAALVDDGVVCAVKYAIARQTPRRDNFLRALLDRVDRQLVVSGLGERPTLEHLLEFGLSGFTSGSVCLAPRAAARLLRALQASDAEGGLRLRAAFMPLEDLRDSYNPIRVLHAAVRLAGVADTGPMLPLLDDLEPEHHAAVALAARQLRAFDASLAAAEPAGPAGAGS